MSRRRALGAGSAAGYTAARGPRQPPISAAGRLARLAVRTLGTVVPKDDRSAVLFGIPAANDAIRALLPQLHERGVRTYLLVDAKADEATASDLGADAVLYRRRPAALWRYLRCRHSFLTHGLYGLAPLRGQVIVNLWHGELTKQIGYWKRRVELPSSYVVATSRLTAALRCAEFGVRPDQVLIVGNPRSDVLLSVSRDQARAGLGIPEQTFALLWMPTYRWQDGVQHAPPSPSPDELDRLDAWLGANNALVLVKQHPLIAPTAALPERHNVRPIAVGAASIADLMAASDGLVTDFSSIWSDYLLLDRPIWIYWPDHERFDAADALPLDPAACWSAGPLLTTVDQLTESVEAFLGAGVDTGAQRRAWLRAVVHRYDDGQSTTRLLEALDIKYGRT